MCEGCEVDVVIIVMVCFEVLPHQLMQAELTSTWHMIHSGVYGGLPLCWGV